MEDLDQVLLVMAQKIGDFLPYIGGPEYAHILVPLFESLCTIEEITTRTAASASASKILSQCSSVHSVSIQAYFELFQRMSNEETGELFYGRVSACQMIPDLYRASSTADRPAVREIYGKLVVDDLAMVRRAAGLSFVKLASFVEPEILSAEFLQLMKSTASDEHATVKVIATDNLCPFVSQLKQKGIAPAVIGEILPCIKSAVEDPSWRIRQSIAKNYGSFATSFTGAEVSSEIFPGAMLLLQDAEPEVRTSVLQDIAAFVSVVMPSPFLGEFMPMTAQLVDDPVSNVRKVLAEVLIDIAAIVGVALADQHITDILMKLIADEDPLVRLRILKKLNVLAEQAPGLCSRMTESLKAMFKDTNWRVRKGLALSMPSLVKSISAEYFCDNFMADFLLLLKVGTIRFLYDCS